MLPIVIVTAASVAANAVAQNRQKRGLPPAPPSRDDKLAGALIWIFILLSALPFAAFVGMFFYAAIKLASALQGYSFP